jgi:hypothetical protein
MSQETGSLVTGARIDKHEPWSRKVRLGNKALVKCAEYIAQRRATHGCHDCGQATANQEYCQPRNEAMMLKQKPTKGMAESRTKTLDTSAYGALMAASV